MATDAELLAAARAALQTVMETGASVTLEGVQVTQADADTIRRTIAALERKTTRRGPVRGRLRGTTE